MKRGIGQGGFSLTELLVVMIIFSFVIAGVSQMFVSILGDFKQQSRMAVSNIEGILGLEMMRHDLEHAGYGLAWDGFSGLAYAEVNPAADALGGALNDAPPAAPRALVSGNNNAGWHGTDRVAVKAVNVALNSVSDRWTYLLRDSVTSTEDVYVWTSATGTVTDNPTNTDRIIVISPGANTRALVPLNAGGFSTDFLHATGSYSLNRSTDSVIYAVGPTAIKMPYNRADYYVADAGAGLPGRCAPGTGVLYKAVANQGGQSPVWQNVLPVLDCVADMQIAYQRDTDGNGSSDNTTDDIKVTAGGATATAKDIRDQVMEVRVYILAQEGQYDRNLTFRAPVPPSSYRVGETGIGRDFDLAANIPDWQHYRWKLYTMVVRPTNISK